MFVIQILKNVKSPKLWDLVPVYADHEEPKADAETLFKKVILTVTVAEIDTDKIIAFCSDGANVMVGEKNSVATRMTALKEDIIKIKCHPHTLHLCARDAIQVIPPVCINLISLIHNYITSGSQ